MFGIRIETGPHENDEGWPYALGRIVLGEFTEPFEATLAVWTARQYEAQWRDAGLRLLGGLDAVMFVASYHGPGALYHFTWPAWRDRTEVIFQNRLVLQELLDAPFDPWRTHEFVGARQSLSEDGQPVSEWRVELEAVRQFFTEPLGSYVPA